MGAGQSMLDELTAPGRCDELAGECEDACCLKDTSPLIMDGYTQRNRRRQVRVLIESSGNTPRDIIMDEAQACYEVAQGNDISAAISRRAGSRSFFFPSSRQSLLRPSMAVSTRQPSMLRPQAESVTAALKGPPCPPPPSTLSHWNSIANVTTSAPPPRQATRNKYSPPVTPSAWVSNPQSKWDRLQRHPTEERLSHATTDYPLSVNSHHQGLVGCKNTPHQGISLTPSPSPHSHHDLTPSSLDRIGNTMMTPASALKSARTRGLAWTPDSAADVAKLRGGVAATPSSAACNTACHGIDATGGSEKLPTPTFNLAVDDKENLRLNIADASRSSPAGVPSCQNTQKGAAPRIKFMTPLLQRWSQSNDSPGAKLFPFACHLLRRCRHGGAGPARAVTRIASDPLQDVRVSEQGCPDALIFHGNVVYM